MADAAFGGKGACLPILVAATDIEGESRNSSFGVPIRFASRLS